MRAPRACHTGQSGGLSRMMASVFSNSCPREPGCMLSCQFLGWQGWGWGGIQGRLVVGLGPLGSDPHPHGQQAKASGPQVFGRLKSLLPILGVLGVSDENGEPRMQLRATWGLLILEFWTPGQELLGKGYSQKLPLPPTSPP
ncbi:hypothetical protein HJG60_009826 [Phyllostomus discolor]|uniref:Uncharacterized protein n=1 Tax=Phyllostomus discolor TaxID=89673 RepID=A0A834B8M1_9CHIR|nr:hypothetical protein HJG60_009826 [Phyllostomus discolor]